MKNDEVEISDVTIIENMSSLNNAELWKENKWYQVPFDVIVCVQTEGDTICAKANIYGRISHNNVQTRRGSLFSAARYVSHLGGTGWEKASDYFNFPVLNGELFMVEKPTFSARPHWINVRIQVIPYPRP